MSLIYQLIAMLQCSKITCFNFHCFSFYISSRILKMLPPYGAFASNSVFFDQNYLQSSHYKSKGCNHCSFLFTSLLQLRSFFFLRQCDFKAYRAQNTCLFRPFHSNDCKFRQLGFQKNQLDIHVHMHLRLCTILNSFNFSFNTF